MKKLRLIERLTIGGLQLERIERHLYLVIISANERVPELVGL